MHAHGLTLEELGLTPELRAQFEPHAAAGLAAARVGAVDRGEYTLLTGKGELRAVLGGRLRHSATQSAELPVSGDWVAALPLADEGRAVIHAVLPRRTVIERKTPGTETRAQVLAANVDLVLIVLPLDREPNLRALERYLAIGWESGAEPAIVLTKSDLCAGVAGAVAVVEAVAFGVPTLAVSSVTGEGLDDLRPHLRPGRTAVLLGPSGAGKSSLVNRLAGKELQAVADLGAVGKGRHTTSRCELVALPDGCLLLDTPGLRELGLWDSEAGVRAVFADIESLAAACRFRDCAHRSEPGCAVTGAVASGTLELERLTAYRKLERELAMLARRQDKRAAAEERRRYRAMNRARRRARW